MGLACGGFVAFQELGDLQRKRHMEFLHALGGVFGLMLMGFVGFMLAARHWFGSETRIMLPRLITQIALPPFLMYTIMHSFHRNDLLMLAKGALLPLCSVVLTFALAVIIAKFARIKRQHFGLFCASVSNSNTIFVGIPVNLALFGENSVPYVLLYYAASTVFFWTVGQYSITCDITDSKCCIPLHTRLLQMFSPPLMGFMTGVGLTLLGIELPEFLQNVARSLGNLTTPLAMIFIGISIYDMGLRSIRISKDMALLVVGRMVLGPLVMSGFLLFFTVPPLMAKVFIIQASLPVMAQAAILSAHYHTDPEFGAQAVSLTTLLSMITIPLYMAIF